MALLLNRLGRAAAAHGKRALALAIAGVVLTGALASLVGGEFVDDFSVPGTPSQQARDLLEERFPAAAAAGDPATVVFAAASGTVRDPERAGVITAAVRRMEGLPNVSGVVSPLSRGGGSQVSRDGRIAFATVQYDRPADDLGAKAYDRLEEAARPARTDGLEVSMRGQVVDVAQQQQSLPIGELIGVAAAILILTLVFRSVVAMTITLVASLLALVSGLMLLRLGAAATDIPSVAPTLGIMLGLGAGVDYALLVTARFRERLAAGEDAVTAAGHANATAGVSVLTAGAIVVVAISGLLATGIPFVGRMGIATAVVVATVAVGAVTLLPALLGAAARRLRPPAAPPGMPLSGRWAQRVGRHPWRYAVTGALLLALLAVPVTQLRLGMPDDGNQSPDMTQRVAYDRIAEGFGAGTNATILVAAEVPPGERAGDAALRRIAADLEAEPGVAAVGEAQRSPKGDAAVIGVVPESSPQDEATADLVQRLRSTVIPDVARATGVRAYVGGVTAVLQDTSDRVAERLPVFIAVVVGLSLLLLIVVFRSIWVPVISAVFNLLSVLAAYGVVVAVFQLGIGGSLIGVAGEVPIVAFVPLFMFALLFGLSMDYNVFLQSRIHEEYRAGAGAHASVVSGLAATGRVITAAGAIMILVFLGFVLEDDVVVKMIGLGLATAILVDVVIVRLLLAPAVMFLLGDRAWWLPGWLDRLLPEIHVEGSLGDAPAAAS